MINIAHVWLQRVAADGSRIVFTRGGGGSHEVSLWAMGADGADEVLLRRDVMIRFRNGKAWASFSPDGSRIAFCRAVGNEYDLFTMAADGTDVKQVTRTPDRSELHPSWSPEGATIAFVAKAAGSPNGWEKSVFIVPHDGGEARQLTSSEFNDTRPSWVVSQ